NDQSIPLSTLQSQFGEVIGLKYRSSPTGPRIAVHLINAAWFTFQTAVLTGIAANEYGLISAAPGVPIFTCNEVTGKNMTCTLTYQKQPFPSMKNLIFLQYIICASVFVVWFQKCVGAIFTLVCLCLGNE
ncbi:unnamed protein product, partial [Didymodactylos carnosus]